MKKIFLVLALVPVAAGLMSASDPGTGTRTVMRQLAGERLGLPLDDVRFELLDRSQLDPLLAFADQRGGGALVVAGQQLDPANPERAHPV